MSSIEVLPLLRTIVGVQTQEDLIFSLAFYYDDNITPISLSGISFTAEIGSIATLSTEAGSIVISGADDNILTLTELEASKASWPAASYPFTLVADDGLYTRDVFGISQLVVGAPNFVSVIPLPTGGLPMPSIATYLPAALANLITIAAQVQAAFTVRPLTTSQTLNEPGIYVATETGQTFVLPNTWAQVGSITVTDGTGLSRPGFFVTGVINGVEQTVNYYTQGQSNTWWFYGASWYNS